MSRMQDELEAFGYVGVGLYKMAVAALFIYIGYHLVKNFRGK